LTMADPTTKASDAGDNKPLDGFTMPEGIARHENDQFLSLDLVYFVAYRTEPKAKFCK